MSRIKKPNLFLRIGWKINRLQKTGYPHSGPLNTLYKENAMILACVAGSFYQEAKYQAKLERGKKGRGVRGRKKTTFSSFFPPPLPPPPPPHPNVNGNVFWLPLRVFRECVHSSDCFLHSTLHIRYDCFSYSSNINTGSLELTLACLPTYQVMGSNPVGVGTWIFFRQNLELLKFIE